MNRSPSFERSNRVMKSGTPGSLSKTGSSRAYSRASGARWVKSR